MKRLTIGLMINVMLLNSGCAALRDELRYPGGVPGRLLDKRTFDSSESKQLQLLRAALAIAIAARIGEGSVATEDADAFARQLAEASNELNYAAVDAGFPVEIDQISYLGPCQVEAGVVRTELPAPAPSPSPTGTSSLDYRALDASCAGFYVNFEAHISKIESRVIRAMLTSLPTDKARDFIDDLAKGDLLSALWSLTGSVGDLAGAFHRGAGVYRAGTENLAASTPACSWEPSSRWRDDDRYDERFDTVLKASACLGLSSRDLFDSDDISAQALPNRINPLSLIALFRIARASCVNLPLLNTSDEDVRTASLKSRDAACDHLYFDPALRPTDLDNTHFRGQELSPLPAVEPQAGGIPVQSSVPIIDEVRKPLVLPPVPNG